MRAIILGMFLVLAVGAIGATKPVVTKFVKPDTTYKVDTIVKYDTFLVAKQYRDTSIFLKAETTKVTPKVAPKPVKK